MLMWSVTSENFAFAGHLYIQSDVYGFGVVLLEMLTGSRVMDRSRPKGKHNLVEWSKPYLFNKRKIVTIMDPNLKGEYSIAAVLQTAKLASECLEYSPKKRPSMTKVVERLEKIEVSTRKPLESWMIKLEVDCILIYSVRRLYWRRFTCKY